MRIELLSFSIAKPIENKCSPAQYEAYFKKTGRPKNLKKHEWRAVFAKVDELATKGIETRVKVSGQVFSKKRLERSRRYALAGSERLQPDRSGML